MSQTTGSEPMVIEQTVLRVVDVDAIPWESIPSRRGAHVKVLWRDRASYAGLLWLEPGAELVAHSHHGAVHHVWVTEGTCSIEGRWLGPGAYVHVPKGLVHGVAATGWDGCRLFYLYLDEKMS